MLREPCWALLIQRDIRHLSRVSPQSEMCWPFSWVPLMAEETGHSSLRRHFLNSACSSSFSSKRSGQESQWPIKELAVSNLTLKCASFSSLWDSSSTKAGEDWHLRVISSRNLIALRNQNTPQMEPCMRAIYCLERRHRLVLPTTPFPELCGFLVAFLIPSLP